jgi:hypothetical protein
MGREGGTLQAVVAATETVMASLDPQAPTNEDVVALVTESDEPKQADGE